MNKQTFTQYIIVGTYYTLSGEISHTQCVGNMFSTQGAAREWLISDKGMGLVKKCSEYASNHGMSLEFLQNDNEGLSYILDVIDGDKIYPSIQYDIVAIKYKNRKVDENI